MHRRGQGSPRFTLLAFTAVISLVWVVTTYFLVTILMEHTEIIIAPPVRFDVQQQPILPCSDTPLPFQQIGPLHDNTDQCLKYASELLPSCDRSARILYHTQWIFGSVANAAEQVAKKADVVFKAFLVTQSDKKLYIWTDDIQKAIKLLPWIEHVPRLVLKKWDPVVEAKDTPVEKMSERALKSNDGRNWKGGDLLRIVILYKYGGLYFDLDVMFARDFAPLYNQDFIYNWPCPHNREHRGDGNGAIMFSMKPKGEMVTGFAAELVRSEKSGAMLGWGSELYKRAQQAGTKFQLLPACFFDAMWPREMTGCDHGEGELGKWMFDDFWKPNLPGIKKFSDFYPGAFAFHWHNRWGVNILPTSPFGLAQQYYQAEWLKLYPEFGTPFAKVD